MHHLDMSLPNPRVTKNAPKSVTKNNRCFKMNKMDFVEMT